MGTQKKPVGDDDVVPDAEFVAFQEEISLTQGEQAAKETGGGNAAKQTAKLAMIQAKSKILKSLSSQHMVEHMLPVVVSLKHCLEAAKSPLQGALMEFIVGLTQTHKVEVDTALRFDPMLKVRLTSIH